MSRDVTVPGRRDVRASLDGPEDDTVGCVVACPPHPQAGGSRSNPVVKALGEALEGEGLATLRFDYGSWTEGAGEVTDAVQAVKWAGDRYDDVGLFGYSFGASVALTAAAVTGVIGVSVLAPSHRLPSLDTIDALERATVPVQVLYGERDRVVDPTPVAERATELGHVVETLPADHHFVGQQQKVAGRVVEFFVDLINGTA